MVHSVASWSQLANHCSSVITVYVEFSSSIVIVYGKFSSSVAIVHGSFSSELTFEKFYQPFGVFWRHLSVSFLKSLFNSLSYLQWHFPKPKAKLEAKARRSLLTEALQKRPTSFSFELYLAKETYELYSVTKTHRMPWVAGHFSRKSHYLQDSFAENDL